jgi:hypothetical protein
LEACHGLDSDSPASVYKPASVLSDQLSTGTGMTRMVHGAATLRAQMGQWQGAIFEGAWDYRHDNAPLCSVQTTKPIKTAQ